MQVRCLFHINCTHKPTDSIFNPSGIQFHRTEIQDLYVVVVFFIALAFQQNTQCEGLLRQTAIDNNISEILPFR